MASGIQVLNIVQQYFEVVRPVPQVEIHGIDDQQGRIIVMIKEIDIGLVNGRSP